MKSYFVAIMIVTLFLPLLVVSSAECSACSTTVKGLALVTKHLLPTSITAQFLEILCIRKYNSKDLCKKVGQQIAPIAISNLIKNYLNPDHICSQLCGKIYKHYNSDDEVFRILTNVSKQTPWDKYKINLQKFVKRKQLRMDLNPQKNLNILHLSDIHLDQHYTQKTSISCSYPICCHPEHGYPQNPSAQAKPLGSKNCDSPIKLVQSMLDSLDKLEQNIDIVIATGDFSAHNQWQKTQKSIEQNNQLLKQKITNANKLKNSLFIRSQGNNDYSPDHQYDPSEPKNAKLIEITTIKDQVSNITVAFIILNTISYDNYNLFLLGDQSYAVFQLMILEKQLRSYDKVYLLGHIPPTLDQTAPEYAKVLRALIARYSTKIIGQFYGHTHMDQLTINTHPGDSSVVTNFAFITPSVSPYNVGKSKYRIYKAKFDNNQQSNNGITNYVQYMLKDLNSTDQAANWVIDYQFRSKYKVQSPSSSPITKQDIKGIVNKIMQENSSTRKTYLRSLGMQQMQNSTLYCWILDSPADRIKCSKTISASFSSKLYTVMDIIRGKWGYDLKDADVN